MWGTSIISVCDIAGECAPGWREAYGLCYQLNKEVPLRMSWIDAVDFCRQQGASILKIER